MRKRTLFFLLFVLIIFTGGFLSGIFFSSHNDKTSRLLSLEAPFSHKAPKPKQQPNWQPEKQKVLIGYVQDFRDPKVVDYSKLTHVIFSFAHPTKDGKLLLNGDHALTNLRAIVSNAEKHDTKVLLALGGWYHMNGGDSYDYFKAAITNPDSRTRLVNELTGITEREKLNGIDIDFEHPRSKEDAKNLAAFTKELSEKLHPNGKELSIAVHAKIHSVTGTESHYVVYDPTMFQYVDHVNIMAYDGQYDGEYNAANLSSYPFTEKIINYWTNLFDTYQLSREKLVLGVPFYGQPENPNIKQVSYAAIVKNHPESSMNDTVNMNGTVYHFNGEKTMQKKTKLALQNDLGGIMLWEAGLDATGPNSLTSSISEILNTAS
jgi:chitinase